MRQHQTHFSARLGYALFVLALNNTDLAAAVGVAESTLRNWLAGKGEPGVGQLRKIAGFLNLPVSWLLEDKAPLAADATPLPDAAGSDQQPAWGRVSESTDWMTLAAEMLKNNVSPREALTIIRAAKEKQNED